MFLALMLQCVAVLLVGVTGWFMQDGLFALALLYGGLVALANSGLLVIRCQRGSRDYHCDGQRHLKSFNRSMLERFFVVGVLLAVGFGLLNLPQFVMLSGFIVGQLAWVVSIVLTRRLF
jgi:hypothetical protein